MTEWREVEEPRIWVSRFMSSLDHVDFNWTCDGDMIRFLDAVNYRRGGAMQVDAPKALFFARSRTVKASVKDAFGVRGPLWIISRELRDILVRFDIGRTQLFEVPIHADDRGTPSGLPNHYVLHVVEPKSDTVIVELSDKLEKPILPSRTEPEPGTRWAPKNSVETLAVRAEAVAGADLWHDPEVNYRFFLSDRLKQAIDAADLKVRALDLYRARVFAAV